MLDYDLSLNGAPSLAALSGSAVTRNARLSVPAARLILDQLSARITLGGGQANLNIDTALPDGGSLRITGPISLAAPYQASLAAQLRNATLREPSLFETTANGDLTLTGALTGGARIGGQIDLGRVELRIPQLGPSYSSLSGLKHIDPPADVARTLRFAGLSQTPGTAPAPSTAFPLDLRITAQNRIFVRGRGLDAELGGDLRLTGTTRDIVPVGQFDLIRGRLDLLRRRLELTEGSISLRGSFDPQLIFAATTQVDDTDITIGISGPASEPALKVSSSPELPQDQVLALFLFGRDVTSLSALQAVQLASAIRTLTGQGGLGLTQQIRGGLGLDDLDIGTADDGTTQARVGKYISDNIYTDATVKSTGEAQINLNLDLSDTVTVRGRVGSDGDTGIGIFFERDY
jgi:translocation and assembly module TamB